MLNRSVQCRTRLFWTIGLLLSFGFASSSSAATLAELVAAYGLQPIDPPRPAKNFRLPALRGGESALSDYQGDWVILTFWASWCGPCRSEMPSLELLQRQHAEQGVVVLGVSLDEDRASAIAFADELDLSFPMLWDDTGQVGADYRASAIPVSFLVAPTGSIVAVATGARDWVRMTPLFEELMTELSAGDSVAAEYASSGEVELPSVAAPPTAELILSQTDPKVGEEFELEIRLRWAGELEEYLPQPPKVHLPEGVVQSRVRASTDSRQGSHVVTYSAALVANSPGTFALDPVELRYTPKFATSAVTSRVLGPTVVVRPKTIAGLRPIHVAFGAGGLLVVAVLGLAAGRHWRSSKTTRSEQSDVSLETLEREVNEAKALRLKGDGKGFLIALIDLVRKLEIDESFGEKNLRELEEGARYGGTLPPRDTQDQMLRTIDRRLAGMKPDDEESARRALRLRNGVH